jgi:hypothetical protein
MPPVETWDTFPFDGELMPRALLPPVAQEEPRRGVGGRSRGSGQADGQAHRRADGDYVS